MLRMMTTLTFSLVALSCGAQNTNQLHDIGTDIEPAKRTLEVMLGFPNDEILDRQFRLLSKAAGLNETLSLQLYGAIDLEGEYVEFLSTPGLKYGDIVTEGTVFKMSATIYSGDSVDYKIGYSLPKTYEGYRFEQSEKDGKLIALSGYWSVPVTDAPTQSPEGGAAKKLIHLCKDIALKHPLTQDFRKMACDLNIADGKLQITYNKTEANPQGTTFAFAAPAVL
jgi:hypothetical protein